MTPASILETLTLVLTNAGTKIIAFLPRLLTALVLLIFGWFIARLLRAIVTRFVSGLDTLWRKFVVKSDLARVQSRYPPTKVIGEISFWAIILLFVSLAADILGLSAFVSWISQVVSYFPLVLAGLVIIVAGIILSSLVRDLVGSAASSAGAMQANLLGRTAQVIILMIAIVIGVDQIGIDITFITIIAAILMATTLGAVALAFGIGAREHVANIIGGYHARQRYRAGDTIRIRDIEGKISRISATRIVIDAAEGQVTVPARIVDSETAVLIERED